MPLLCEVPLSPTSHQQSYHLQNSCRLIYWPVVKLCGEHLLSSQVSTGKEIAKLTPGASWFSVLKYTNGKGDMQTSTVRAWRSEGKRAMCPTQKPPSANLNDQQLEQRHWEVTFDGNIFLKAENSLACFVLWLGTHPWGFHYPKSDLL